jgi:protein ImuB
MGLRAARLGLYRSDGTCAQVRLATSSPTRTPAHLMGLLIEKLGTLDLGFGVDLLVLDALHLEPLRDHQATLMGPGAEHGATGGLLIDRLANRLGAARVTRIAPQASHWPEYTDTRRPALAWPMNAACIARPATPRPHVLFKPPEPITVMVDVPEGVPTRFIWRRVTHTIVRSGGPERIEPEWWREVGPPTSGTRMATRFRDYYALEDEAGARFWVFRSGCTDGHTLNGAVPDEGSSGRDVASAWFVHGLFG